jgi:hypothetical protein
MLLECEISPPNGESLERYYALRDIISYIEWRVDSSADKATDTSRDEVIHECGLRCLGDIETSLRKRHT